MSDMVNLVRREVIETAQTLVVKVGTNVLSREDDTLDLDRIAVLAKQIHGIRESGPAGRRRFQRCDCCRAGPAVAEETSAGSSASSRPPPPQGKRT